MRTAYRICGAYRQNSLRLKKNLKMAMAENPTQCSSKCSSEAGPGVTCIEIEDRVIRRENEREEERLKELD